jgi:hypothetical protein
MIEAIPEISWEAGMADPGPLAGSNGARRGAQHWLVLLVLACAAGGGRPAWGAPESEVIHLEQGWSAEVRDQFYFTPQGSRLMPYAWFVALEQAGSTEPFTAASNLAKFGWLIAATKSPQLNPDGLPVGFTRDVVDLPETGKWVGMTCAACHTNDVVVAGKTVRIDGAPTLADLSGFTTSLNSAVQATLIDGNKFARFAAKVLGGSPSPDQIARLNLAFLSYATTFAGQTWMRTPAYPEGPGRVDALGLIINAMSVSDLEVPENLRPNAAPVSYPFLWYTSRLAWVQWNPVAASPIARNAGEVLGVFGTADFTSRPEETVKPSSRAGMSRRQELARDYVPLRIREQVAAGVPSAPEDGGTGKLLSSSVLYRNLHQIEQWVATLTEPRWDDELFGAVDEAAAKKGKQLFDNDCRACHNMPPFDLTPKEENHDKKQFIKIGRVGYKAVGTDPVYIESLISRFTKTGNLADLFEGKPVVPTAQFFLGTVGVMVEQELDDLGLSPEQKRLYADFRFSPSVAGAPPEPYRPPGATDLKAGPLLGIWATAPFLHNGSIPNLYELLSPPEGRSKEFWVGSRELDREKLGFVSKRDERYFRFDTSIRGNGNQGHVYPARDAYKHEQKLALIEYLKDPRRFSGEEATP